MNFPTNITGIMFFSHEELSEQKNGKFTSY